VALPDMIPIAYEPDYHTGTIGRYVGGQFFASIHGAHPPGADPLDRGSLRWYVVLHLFDPDGRHRSSDIWYAGAGGVFAGAIAEAGEARLRRLLDSLADQEYGDIAIRPFQVEHDGVVFGLIDESDEERGDWAELHPNRLGFGPPWDGGYDT